MRRCPWPQVACAVTARNVCCPGAVDDRANVKLDGKRVAIPKGARLEYYIELLPAQTLALTLGLAARPALL